MQEYLGNIGPKRYDNPPTANPTFQNKFPAL